MRRLTALALALTLLMAPALSRGQSTVFPGAPAGTSGGSGSGPTTEANDPTGWGKTFTPNAVAIVSAGSDRWTNPVFLDDTTAVALVSRAGNTVDVIQSTNKGRTWVTTTAGTALIHTLLNGLMHTGTSWLVGVNDAANGIRRSTTGPNGPWNTVTVSSGGPITSVASFARQGTTILAHAIAGGATDAMCRSTNDGATWTCINMGVNAPGATNMGAQTLASPVSNVWVVVGITSAASGIWRSIDDGLTWTDTGVVGATGTVGEHGVLCLSTTVCAAMLTNAFFRSSDAGATWPTTVASFIGAGATQRFRSAVNFGNGVAVFLPDLITLPTGRFGMRTNDAFATFVPTAPINQAVCSGGFMSGSSGSATNGIGDAVVFQGCAPGPSVLPFTTLTVPAGSTTISGPTGDLWDINTSGQGGVYQGQGTTGAGAAGIVTTRPWRSSITQAQNILQGAPTVSGANAAATVTLTGVANTLICVHHIGVFASAVGTATLNVTSATGPVVMFNMGTLQVGPQVTTYHFQSPICGVTGANVTINVGAAGGGITTTTSVIADRQ